MARVFMQMRSIRNRFWGFSEMVGEDGCIMQADAHPVFLHVDNYILLMFKDVRTALIPVFILIAVISVIH